MGNYFVYIRIPKTNGEFTEIVITGIEAGSALVAEHRILDNYRCIDNALAFDVDTEMNAMTPYLRTSKCLDYKDFIRRYKDMINHRQAVIDDCLDEIDYVKNETVNYWHEITKLEREIANLKEKIANNDNYVKYCTDNLEDYCKKTKMAAKHSTDECVIGIA